jgi:hypothetical protein
VARLALDCPCCGARLQSAAELDVDHRHCPVCLELLYTTAAAGSVRSLALLVLVGAIGLGAALLLGALLA